MIFDTDGFLRRGTTIEVLSKLSPAFKKDGTVTAGNSSGINDGAAAVIVMWPDKARELGIRPVAKVKSFAAAGVEPAHMGIGPVPASPRPGRVDCQGSGFD